MNKEHAMLEARELQAQGLSQKEISQALGVTDRTIRTYLKSPPRPRKKPERKSKLDAYKATIDSVLETHPRCNLTLLHEQLAKAGYCGQISILRDYAREKRKTIEARVVLRFETEPGYQAQVDWKDWGCQVVNGKRRKLYTFVMTLGYSRKPFEYFTTSCDEATLLACHVLAFEYFGGVPREILYDNMKTAFIWNNEAGQFEVNTHLLALSVHYGFIPRRCMVRRPQTKGKVEREIGYLSGNFWPRLAGTPLEINEVNDRCMSWRKERDQMIISGMTESRNDRFEKEKDALKSIPSFPYDTRREVFCTVNRESYITYQTNRYSVPPHLIGHVLTLKIQPFSNVAEICDGETVIRAITLEQSGERMRITDEEDMRRIKALWKKQFTMSLSHVSRKKHVHEVAGIDVVIRPTSEYGQFEHMYESTGVTQ